jgi:hypothetical protein
VNPTGRHPDQVGKRMVARWYWAFVAPDAIPEGAMVFTHPLPIEMAQREFARLDRISKLSAADWCEEHDVHLRVFHSAGVMHEPRYAKTPEELWREIEHDQRQAALEVFERGPTAQRTVLCAVPIFVR